MALYLIINTAVEPFGFSLERDGNCLVAIKRYSDRSFSESLLGLIDSHCRLFDSRLEDIRGIGVINGPGSYTGLRIGVSYAKTLSYTLHCPVVGISSLEALAYQVIVQEDVFAIILSAKPGYVYFQLFHRLNDGGVSSVSDLLLIQVEDCFNLLQGFRCKLSVYICSKLNLFEALLHSYLTIYFIDIACERLFVLLHSKLLNSSEGSFKHVKLNYICQPKIGS
ncbi:tRNA (adenosine(37)-N6)-threonylcarbamoyltransferase complex dimerization subunit type 1 TsaB [Candidatus Marinamargulisbacteria bacterium SCGC AG-333-B06]|nr:tRNA (adenosine(37)-N6)-threonylcarbamoyltransferase complex dimerization subunit type 1 TsaB [Candidatus Marinamargulisbacteria bacterium SCGC AG-333-B06]